MLFLCAYSGLGSRETKAVSPTQSCLIQCVMLCLFLSALRRTIPDITTLGLGISPGLYCFNSNIKLLTLLIHYISTPYSSASFTLLTLTTPHTHMYTNTHTHTHTSKYLGLTVSLDFLQVPSRFLYPVLFWSHVLEQPEGYQILHISNFHQCLLSLTFCPLNDLILTIMIRWQETQVRNTDLHLWVFPVPT